MARTAQTRSPDAISLLRSDHRKVEELFERYEKSRINSVKAGIADDPWPPPSTETAS